MIGWQQRQEHTMKPIYYLLAALGVFAAMPLPAQTNTDHASHHPDQQVTAAGKDVKDQVAGGTAAAAKSMPMMAQMDEHMKNMHTLHEKMMGAATPEERQKAMEEARKEMQEGMATMKPMMQDGGMMGGGMMGGGMMGEKGKSGDPRAQMQMMGKRMDMMQMMMQMMMDQQGMMGQPKASEAVPKK
jgi:hypothetical protein